MPSSAAPAAAVEIEKPKHNICFEGQHDSASREEAMQAKESQAARMQAEEAREGEHALQVPQSDGRTLAPHTTTL